MKPGEYLRVLVDYNLYGLNLKDLKGIYIKTLENGKYLTFFKENEEWAELSDDQVKRSRPGFVSEKNKKFVDRAKTMIYTFEVDDDEG
jgi:ubiquitin C-terminal hydrolase